MTKCVPLMLLAVLQPVLAGKAETALLAQLRQAHPATRFDRVMATPVAGLYEVWMGDNVAYVRRGNVRYLVFGHLFDAREMRDLTVLRTARDGAANADAIAAQEHRPGAADLSALSAVDATVLVRGSGRRHLVVLTDPACGYCRQLDATLRQLDDVTILHYLVPFQGTELPEAIWCAPDRDATYAQVMAGGAPPGKAGRPCVSPLARNTALAARLGVHATPTLFFADGRRATGVLSHNDIEDRLAQAAAGKEQAKSIARSEHETSHQR